MTAAEMAELNAELMEGMQGAWQLLMLEIDDLDAQGRQEVATLLVVESFMSIELHLAYFNEENIQQDFLFQSGTYRIRWEDIGQMRTETVIGADYNSDDNALRFENPGSERDRSAPVRSVTSTSTCWCRWPPTSVSSSTTTAWSATTSDSSAMR